MGSTTLPPALRAALRALGLAWALGWLLLAGVAQARPGDPVRIDRLPAGLLGPQLLYLQEAAGRPLDLDQARQAYARGAFHADARPLANFGVGARPVWLRLALRNSLDEGLTLQLRVGMSWLDHIVVYQVRDGRTFGVWESGDEADPGNAAGTVRPGQGFEYPLWVPSGDSEVYVRVDSVDAMALPVTLNVPATAWREQEQHDYGYGLLYGYLFALVLYNALIFAGVRKGSYLHYAAYLLAFVGLDLAYTGHGLALLWPGQVYFQRFAIPLGMVLFAVAGLGFAMHFLRMKRVAPRLRRALIAIQLGVALLLAVCIVADWHLAALRLGFLCVSVYALGMVAIGSWAVLRRLQAASYFLLAALSGLGGHAASLAQSMGLLPMTTATFHAAEIGAVLEGTLLALALARDIRSHQEARERAELLARVDALTGLLNRRAFYERAQGLWSVAQRRARPISLLMLDIDHFKSINDRFGHAGGDLVLKRVADILTTTCRNADLIVRWGGEEFLLLLPETDQEEATLLAERLRRAIAAEVIELQGTRVDVRASFGVCQARGQPTLEQLVDDTDQWLYQAKRIGRNRVMGPPVVAFPELGRTSELGSELDETEQPH
ncbi:MAG: GGDEF domain-containing protein [Pelomonas sp.]|nr:GGDEF domain-containing protein [Roseateles sp.]